jgi:hypothetical protein
MPIDESVAMAIVERRPQDVASIANRLKQLREKPGDDSFLVVSVGDDVYVQFFAPLAKQGVAVESVANEYLPAEKQLDEAGIEALLGLGFARPEAEGDNFSMDFELKNDADFALLAVLTLAAFDVYGCQEGETFDFELNL